MLVPRESWSSQVKVHADAWKQESDEAELEGHVALMYPDPFQGSRTGKLKIYKSVEHQVAQQSWPGDWEADTARKQW